LRFPNRESEEGAGRRFGEGGADRRARPVSGEREGKGEGGGRLGRGPGRGAGEGCWASRPKRGRGREIPFLFFMPIFPIEILSRKKKIKESFCFPINHHKRNAPA